MKNMQERRKYIRLQVPVEMLYFAEGNPTRREVATKDLSCDGLRFLSDEDFEKGSGIEINLIIPKASNPVHVQGKVAWAKRLSLEDSSPYEVGVEFTAIEEDNKNTFLKYLCDLIYDQTRSG